MTNPINNTVAAALVFVGTSFGANAATYNVDLTVGSGSAVGYIDNDDTIGVLSLANILDWQFTMTSPNLDGGTPSVISAGSVGSSIYGPVVSATTTELLFDFTASATLLF